MAKYDFVGVMPGSMKVGDLVQNTQAQMAKRQPRRLSMNMPKRNVDAISTTVDYGMPMKMRRPR
jgi:hypothetical protein